MARKRSQGVRSVGKGESKGKGVYFLALTLENVRCFGPKQTLDLSDGKGRPRQWTVILGNNGVGKTTLLHSLVATLPTLELTGYLSPRAMAHGGEFGFNSNLWRDNPEKLPIDLCAHFCSRMRMVDVELFANTFKSKFTLEEAGSSCGVTASVAEVDGLCVLGYGATRRMAAGRVFDVPSEDPVATLFADAPLRNAEEWLLQIDYLASKDSRRREKHTAIRDTVKAMLIALLPDVDDIELLADTGDNPARPRPGIKLKTPYGWVPLQGLSLGYKTLLAWMVDLASRLYEKYPDSENPLAEPAIVLVDEIDLHMHPMWQRQIIDYLSQKFPNTQFIVTAHSPLVVQAATNANVVVLRRENDYVIIDNNPAEVANWRVDQILTSDLFGLPSARPPALDGLLETRKKLLAQTRLTAKDRTLLAQLEQQIGSLPTGETPEQLEAMNIIERAAKALKKTGSGTE